MSTNPDDKVPRRMVLGCASCKAEIPIGGGTVALERHTQAEHGRKPTRAECTPQESKRGDV